MGETTVRCLIRAASSCSRASCNLKRLGMSRFNSLQLICRDEVLPSGNSWLRNITLFYISAGHSSAHMLNCVQWLLQSRPANGLWHAMTMHALHILPPLLRRSMQSSKSAMRTRGCRSTLHQCPAEAKGIRFAKHHPVETCGNTMRKGSREPNACGKTNESNDNFIPSINLQIFFHPQSG